MSIFGSKIDEKSDLEKFIEEDCPLIFNFEAEPEDNEPITPGFSSVRECLREREK
jgi:hypothetical protein